MTAKINLLVLCGGQSSEHEVSVVSARSMLEAIDRDKYNVTVVGISRDGHWLSGPDPARVLASDQVHSSASGDLVPVSMRQASLVSARSTGADSETTRIDVVFPLLHGPLGEDGTVQGLLELASVAYVGSGVLGSAMGMDKDIAKRMFTVAGLAQLPYRVIQRQQWRGRRESVQQDLMSALTFPMFVKPANAGSSIGVSKVRDPSGIGEALDLAAQYDSKLVVEQDAGDCHEVECAVIGNDDLRASVVGEIIPASEFYDYADKYINGATDVRIPAPIPDAVAAQVRDQALAAFRAVEAAGLARVDFFVRRDSHEVFINEINTMPGFTPISMYPKLWQASGLSYPQLIDELVQLALQRRADRDDIRLTT